MNDNMGERRKGSIKPIGILVDNINKLFKEEFILVYNNVQHQFNNSLCGLFSIDFLTRMYDNKHNSELYFNTHFNNKKENRDEIIEQDQFYYVNLNKKTKCHFFTHYLKFINI